ncbi:putative sulfate exporter family transporter [Paenibacillus yanchengensis]|uniref:Sulfate exporter family transporter n=1 Tax=Paenibacillus yanchengensis TaxID=2035833 RepID=A0ABW4YHT1_9BACL
MYSILHKTSGVLLIAFLALPAWFIGEKFPIIGSPIVGIIFGLILSFWKKPSSFEWGVSFCAKKLLQYAIILLGFNMSLYTVFEVGGNTIWLILLTLAATFLTAFLVGKLKWIQTR